MKIDWFVVIATGLTALAFVGGLVAAFHFDVEPILQEPDCGISCMDEKPKVVDIILGLGAVGLMLFVALGTITMFARINDHVDKEKKE